MDLLTVISIAIIITTILLFYQLYQRLNLYLNKNIYIEEYRRYNEQFKDKIYFYLSKYGLFADLSYLTNTMIYAAINRKQFVLVDEDFGLCKWTLHFRPFCTILNKHEKNDNDCVYRYNSYWNSIFVVPKLILDCPFFKKQDVFSRKSQLYNVMFNPLRNPSKKPKLVFLILLYI